MSATTIAPSGTACRGCSSARRITAASRPTRTRARCARSTPIACASSSVTGPVAALAGAKVAAINASARAIGLSIFILPRTRRGLVAGNHVCFGSKADVESGLNQRRENFSSLRPVATARLPNTAKSAFNQITDDTPDEGVVRLVPLADFTLTSYLRNTVDRRHKGANLCHCRHGSRRSHATLRVQHIPLV